MDSQASLSFITENCPAWIARLDDLTGQIASRQAELAELSAARPLKPKHGSTESLRPKDSDERMGGQSQNHHNTAMEPSAASAGAARQHQAQQLRRKRKTASLASASGSPSYRTRSMIIVYYDSAVQEAFEMIVRNIGTARNNIRKGKMAAAMQKMTAMVEDHGSGTDPTSDLRSKLSYARTTRSRGGEEKTVYDHIDAGLDFSQAQCERAAHQFLRDGDCAPEILSIRDKMGEIFALATKEMKRLKMEAAVQAQAKAEEEAAAAAAAAVDEDEGVDVEGGGGGGVSLPASMSGCGSGSVPGPGPVPESRKSESMDGHGAELVAADS
ncbi:MAG: hypothetical protein M1838_001755 [Thelocarpon superellum]|nr:MAG: hypothetical protein M1838_001755 [Thelocarpon superellum]